MNEAFGYHLKTRRDLDLKTPAVPPCRSLWTAVKREYKGPLSLGFASASAHADAEYIWSAGAQDFPKTARFTSAVSSDVSMPPKIRDSMQARMQKGLEERDLAGGTEAYMMEVRLSDWNHQTLGAVADVLVNVKAAQRMTATVRIKKGDEVLARIRVNAYVPTSNIAGMIYRSSNLITDVAASGILDTLEDRMIEKAPWLMGRLRRSRPSAALPAAAADAFRTKMH